MQASEVSSNCLNLITHLHTFSASIAFTFKDCASANLSLSSITILLGGRTAKKTRQYYFKFQYSFYIISCRKLAKLFSRLNLQH